MCRIMEEAMKEREKETILIALKNIMANLKISAEQAINALSIPDNENEYYLKLLKE